MLQRITQSKAYLDWNQYSYNEKLVLMTVVSMFLPYFIGGAVLVANVVRFYRNGTLFRAWEKMPKHKYIQAFLAYGMVISALEKNLIGFLCMIGIAFMISFVAVAREVITKKLFADALRGAGIAIALSVAVCLLAFLFEGSPLTTSGVTWAKHSQTFRDKTKFFQFWFFNANYFAMVIEFTIVVALWSLARLENRNKKMVLGFVAICMVALVLSGSRLGMVTAAMAIVLLLHLEGKKRIAGVLVFIGILAAIDLMGQTPLISRFANLKSDFSIRDAIWTESWKAVELHWLTGVGPMGTLNIIGSIRGILVAHTHNIFLDAILNYGIIGCAILLPVLLHGWKQTKKLPESARNLAVALSFVVVFHGMADVTIFWLQTGMFYLLFLHVLPELTGVAALERRVEERRRVRLQRRYGIVPQPSALDRMQQMQERLQSQYEISRDFERPKSARMLRPEEQSSETRYAALLHLDRQKLERHRFSMHIEQTQQTTLRHQALKREQRWLDQLGSRNIR